MNLDCLLKSIDFFGINFDFRMKNYEKYKTKTGGISFILYFLSSTIYALFVIYSFFTNPSYIRNDFDKYTNNSYSNDNIFQFALRIPDFNNISIRDFLGYKVKYRIRNTSRLSPKMFTKDEIIEIPRKICDSIKIGKENFEKLGFSRSEFVCFDLNKTHKIIGNQFADHTYYEINVYVNKTRYCEYEKSMINILKTDTFYLNLLFPHNIMQDDFVTNIQSLDGIFFRLNEKNKLYTDLYLKEDIYRLDNNFLHSESNDLNLLSYYYHFTDSIFDDTYYNALENTTKFNNNICQNMIENPKVLKIYIRNYVSYSVHFKTRVKLNALMEKVITIYLNFFMCFRMFLFLFSLRKAKINILKNLFQIDFDNIQTNKQLADNQNLKETKDFLKNFIKDLKSEKSPQTIGSFLDIGKKENNFEKIDHINRNKKKSSNFYNENSDISFQNLNNYKIKHKNNKISDSPNMMYKKNCENSTIALHDLNKNNEIILKLSEIKHDNNLSGSFMTKNENLKFDNCEKNENKQKLKFPLKEEDKEINQIKGERFPMIFLLKKLFLCKFRKFNVINNYFKEAEKLFDEYFNVSNYIIKINEIECIKNLILDENEKCLFYFLSYPCLQSPFTTSEVITKNPSSLTWNHKEKFDKNKIAEKIKMVYFEGEVKNINQNLQNMFENKLK